jgi:glucosamine-6-phosphate deaminase
MNICIVENAASATLAAAGWLAEQLTRPENTNLMVAGGNTPLALYREIASRKLGLRRLHIFALDEYVGVPPADPRNCANLIRRTVVDAWGIPASQFHHLISSESEARAGIADYEMEIRKLGGLDLLVLGLGRNGHIGFNEPGSALDSVGRVLDLDAASVEANRQWFGGDYAPSKGVTIGISTILSARQILLLAFGAEKATAVAAMIEGSQSATCPASWLQHHSNTHVFLDVPAASNLRAKPALRT